MRNKSGEERRGKKGGEKRGRRVFETLELIFDWSIIDDRIGLLLLLLLSVTGGREGEGNLGIPTTWVARMQAVCQNAPPRRDPRNFIFSFWLTFNG